MLEHQYADIKFAANIERIANANEAIAKSLAVIAGVVARKDGLNFIDPCKNLNTVKECENNMPNDDNNQLPAIDTDFDDDV